MNKYKNLTGKHFGKLKVEKYFGMDTKHHHLWECHCECGKTILLSSTDLNRKHIKSCGCFSRPIGLSYSRLSRILRNIKQRCYNTNNPRFNVYGAKGITICDEWKNDFMSFYTWAMENGYRDDLTIDRIDVNGNYEPKNCRWISNQEQQFNKNTNVNITYNNKTQCIKLWSIETGIPAKAISWRLKHNWSVERTLTTPILSEYNHHKRR